jgi:hypothetical protein
VTNDHLYKIVSAEKREFAAWVWCSSGDGGGGGEREYAGKRSVRVDDFREWARGRKKGGRPEVPETRVTVS